MGLYTILIVVLIVLLVGGFHPNFAHSYGYYPSGGAGLVLLIILLLFLFGNRL